MECCNIYIKLDDAFILNDIKDDNIILMLENIENRLSNIYFNK